MQAWNVADHVAQLHIPRFSATIDLSRPELGLHNLLADGAAISGSLLQLDWREDGSDGLDNVEHYVRGNDLIVAYPSQDARRLRGKFYWRATSAHLPSALAAIELIAAVETELLDVQPALSLRSEFIASEAFQLTDVERGTFASLVPKPDRSHIVDATGLPSCFLCRLPGGRTSYAEMLIPMEGQCSEWNGWLSGVDYRLELEHRLFAERLEKGVILKSRILAVILDREDDRSAASDCYDSFLAAELPLTA
jgi:hypothetical protein